MPRKPSEPPQLSADQKRRRFDDIVKNGRTMPAQIADWIRDTARVARLVAASNTGLIPVFWIRIYGVLADVAEKLDAALEANTKIPVLAPHELAAGKRVHAAIEAIAAVLNDDELMYLQYRRHVECHPLQSHYRIRMNGRRFEDTIHHRLLDRATTIEDADAAFVRLFHKYAFSEDKIAVDFAQRMLPAIERLESVSPAWYGAPPPKF